MKTAEDRLRFAVGFAQLDLDHVRPGDWLNLREDLGAFLSPGVGGTLHEVGGIIATPLKPPLPKEMPEADFKALQAEVRVLLGGIADHQASARKTQGPIGGALSTFPVDVRYTILPLARLDPPRAILSAHGATRDVTLLVLIHILAQSDLSPIRRCPEDGRLFYRVRRQEYCSRACVNRANKRTWRARESTPRRRRRASRQPKRGERGR